MNLIEPKSAERFAAFSSVQVSKTCADKKVREYAVYLSADVDPSIQIAFPQNFFNFFYENPITTLYHHYPTNPHDSFLAILFNFIFGSRLSTQIT